MYINCTLRYRKKRSDELNLITHCLKDKKKDGKHNENIFHYKSKGRLTSEKQLNEFLEFIGEHILLDDDSIFEETENKKLSEIFLIVNYSKKSLSKSIRIEHWCSSRTTNVDIYSDFDDIDERNDFRTTFPKFSKPSFHQIHKYLRTYHLYKNN